MDKAVLGSALTFVAWIALALPARGDVASEAGFFDALARRAYQRGQYEKALESFQLVQEIAPSQRTLYNIALCADLAGRSDMAFSQYHEYLKGKDPDATRRAEAERRLRDLTPKLALVEIETQPPGATVYLDRKELGQFGVTPTTLAVPAGEHQLRIERADHAPHETTILAERGSRTSVRAALEPWFGTLTVRVAPSTAELQFVRGGVRVAAKLEQGRYRLAVGQYQIMAAAPGFVSIEEQLLVGKDEEAWFELELVPLPQETGRLLVSTGNVAADVFVDGRRMAVTPATLSQLSRGEHALEVRAAERVARRQVTILPGRAVYVAIDLSGAGP